MDLAPSENPPATSCSYRQVFNVIPLLGGLTSAGDRSFNFIEISEDLVLVPVDGQAIRATSGWKEYHL